jgi:acyl-CoA reductase-like NAD-dependent aldehyde dehydrogenase
MVKKIDKKRVLRNPASGKLIGLLHEYTEKELKEALAQAVKAQKYWQRVSLKNRCRFITRMRRYLCQHAERFTRIISECTGKTRIDSLSTEVIPALLAADYYTRRAGKFLKARHIKIGHPLFFYKHSTLYRVPYGIVGIISPWNYPFGIAFHEVVTALLCGNAVILKVATQVQPVGDLYSELYRAAKLPKGLFHLCLLPGKKAGRALLNAGINKLFFTGSTTVGKVLMRQAAAQLIPVSLELGGNNPMIVLKDANLFRAAAGAVWAGLSNCGQSCGRVQRIYVQEQVYDRFREILAIRVKNLTQGFAEDSSYDIGSLTTREQYAFIESQVADAFKKGAKIVAAGKGKNRKGLFYPPMIIEEAKANMRVVKEEVFGPVLILSKVKNASQAVRLANSTHSGLTASVWTKSRQRAERIAVKIEAGSVTANDHLMSHALAQTPWGGFKKSGIGRTHGRQGFEEMTQVKVVVHDGLHFLPRCMWWHPHNDRVYRGLLGLMNAFYGNNLWERLKGFYRMSRLFLRSFKKE